MFFKSPILLFFLPFYLFSESYTWNIDSGNWSSPSNWTPSGPPNAVGDRAIFGNSLTSNATITLTSGFATIGYIDFQNSAFNYTIETDGVSVGELIFNNSPLHAQINVHSTAGSNPVIGNASPGVLFASLDSPLDCLVAKNKNLTFENVTWFESNALNIMGAGNIIFEGMTYTTLPQTLNISGSGNYLFTTNSNTQLPQTLNISGSGTVTLAGTCDSSGMSVTMSDGFLHWDLPSSQSLPNNIAIQGGTLRNSEDNQFSLGPIGESESPTNLTLDGGTWDLNNYVEAVQSLFFYSGRIIGTSNSLTVVEQLSMRNTSLDGSVTLGSGQDFGSPFFIRYDNTNGGTARLSSSILLVNTEIVFDIASGPNTYDMVLKGSLIGVPVSRAYTTTKMGSGTLLLENILVIPYFGNAVYISEGTLLLSPEGQLNFNSGTSEISVASGAVFGGSGTIGSDVSLDNSGTLVLGLSPGVGTLTLDGSYTQNPSGIFNEKLFSMTRADKFVVTTGSVSLDGTLNVTLMDNHALYGNQTLTFIDNQAGTGVTGVFSAVNKIGYPSASSLKIIYQPNEVLLSSFVPDVQALSPGHVSVPTFLQTTQNTFNFLHHLQKIRPVVIGNPSERDKTAENLQASYPKGLVASASSSFMAEREEPLRPYSVATPFRLMPKESKTWGVFGDTVGSLGRVYGSKSNRAYNYSNIGEFIGADYIGENFAIGISPGYEYLKANTEEGISHFNVHSAVGTLFATYLPIENQNFFIDFIGGGAGHWYHFQRNTPEGIASGKPFGGSWNLYTDAGWTFNADDFMYSSKWASCYITPWLGLGYMGASIERYREEGSDRQTFDIDGHTLNSLRSTLGLALDYYLKWDTISLLPEFRVLWQREFLNQDKTTTFTHLPEINGDLEISGIGKDTVLIGAFFRLLFNNQVDVTGSYDYEWNSRFHSHLFMIGTEGRF